MLCLYELYFCRHIIFETDLTPHLWCFKGAEDHTVLPWQDAHDTIHNNYQSDSVLILKSSYKDLHGLAPHYLSEPLTRYSPSHDPRSSESSLLTVPLPSLACAIWVNGLSLSCLQGSGTLSPMTLDMLNLLGCLNHPWKHTTLHSPVREMCILDLFY